MLLRKVYQFVYFPKARRPSRRVSLQPGAATQRAVPGLQSAQQGEGEGEGEVQGEGPQSQGEGEGEGVLQGEEQEPGQGGVQEILRGQGQIQGEGQGQGQVGAGCQTEIINNLLKSFFISGRDRRENERERDPRSSETRVKEEPRREEARDKERR